MRQELHFTTRKPTIGARVTVHLSPECQHTRRDPETGHISHRGHWPQENGQTGTIISWPPWAPPPQNRHNIVVYFFDPPTVTELSGEQTIMTAGAYWIGELELLKEGDDNA